MKNKTFNIKIFFAFTLFYVIITCTPMTYAQTSAGVRLEFGNLGFNKGVTIKHQMTQNHALEGLLTFNKYDWRVTGLYEYHYPLDMLAVDGVSAYGGFGGHFGHGKKSEWDDPLAIIDILVPRTWFVGVDGIVGVQYDVPRLPINVSADIRPGYNFNKRHPRQFDIGLGLSVRWTFGAGGGGGGKGKGKGSGSGSYGNNNRGSGSGTPGTVRGKIGNSKSSGSRNSNKTSPNSKTSKPSTTSPSTSPKGRIKGKIGGGTASNSKPQKQTGKTNPNASNSNTSVNTPTKKVGKIAGKPTTRPVPNPKPKPKPTPRAETRPGGEEDAKDEGMGRTQQGESWNEEDDGNP